MRKTWSGFALTLGAAWAVLSWSAASAPTRAAPAAAGGGGAGGTAGAKQDVATPEPELRSYSSPYYNIFTDVPEDDAREAIIRMTKMAEEYHERTKSLFTGQINQKLPFYLFNTGEEYYAAGGMPGSAGVFNGARLMAMAFKTREGHVGGATWHVVQHEGFHQFVHYVIRGDIPTWVNEGLAEYFGEGVFTGDGMVTGVIPDGRMRRIQAGIKANQFRTVREMMYVSGKEWNSKLSGANYDQAWSMCHFLAEGDDGKYQNAFGQFLQLVGKGHKWDQAWVTAFGSADGFEEKWKEYWLKLPVNPTIDLYAKADVLALTGFLGRAFTQKQTFDAFDEFIETDATSLKAAPADWLPPQLFGEFKQMAKVLQSRGATFELTRPNPKNKQPQLVCTMPDGAKITGQFDAQGYRIGKVRADVVKPATAATKASPAKPPSTKPSASTK